MKTKKKPRRLALGRTLFHVGMDAWLKVDPKKTRPEFDSMEGGQIAAWNAIARYVAKMKR